MRVRFIKEVTDCDGYTHKHVISENGKQFIIVEKEGMNVAARSFGSVEELEAYLNLISAMTNDVIASRAKTPSLTKKTIPITREPVTPVMDIFAPPKKEEQVIHTPRPQKPSAQNQLNIIKASLKLFVEDMVEMIDRVEQLEKELKEGK